jgi:hypothetical protein
MLGYSSIFAMILRGSFAIGFMCFFGSVERSEVDFLAIMADAGLEFACGLVKVNAFEAARIV